MADKNVWFVTGASRGLGVDIVKAALAAGHAVVATGRNIDAVTRSEHGRLSVAVRRLSLSGSNARQPHARRCGPE